MKTLIRILVILLALACSSEQRVVAIKHTSPAMKGTAVVNERLFFAFIVSDSFNHFPDLTAIMRVNGGERIPCLGSREFRNTVDPQGESRRRASDADSGWEYVYRCPYDMSRLADGTHWVHFKVVTEGIDPEENRDSYAKTSVDVPFTYDGTPPAVFAAFVRTDAETATVHWHAQPEEGGIEVEGYRRGVRMFSSWAAQGSVTLARDMLPAGSTLELRIWDAHGNRGVQELHIP